MLHQPDRRWLSRDRNYLACRSHPIRGSPHDCRAQRSSVFRCSEAGPRLWATGSKPTVCAGRATPCRANIAGRIRGQKETTSQSSSPQHSKLRRYSKTIRGGARTSIASWPTVFLMPDSSSWSAIRTTGSVRCALIARVEIPARPTVIAEIYRREADLERLAWEGHDVSQWNLLDITQHAAHYQAAYRRHVRDVLEFFGNKPQRLLHGRLDEPDSFIRMCELVGVPLNPALPIPRANAATPAMKQRLRTYLDGNPPRRLG